MIRPYVHVIAALAVCSRIADVWTTYLVTPTLKLEANSLVRRFGWPYALLTVLIGLVAYVSPPVGVIVLTTSFIVAASNASKIAMARALGEEEMAALSRRVVAQMRPWPGLLFLVLPGLLIGVLGGSLLYFYPSGTQWGCYFAYGMLTYAFAVCIWYPLRYFAVRAELRRTGVD